MMMIIFMMIMMMMMTLMMLMMMLMMMFSESSRHSESYSSSCDAAEAVRLGKDEKLAREAGITFDVKVMTIMITITVLAMTNGLVIDQ